MSRQDCGRGELCIAGRCTPDPQTPRDASSMDAADDGGGAFDASRDASSPDAAPVHDAGCANAIFASGGLSYCTIAEAIAAAAPGSTVDVPSGRFVEALVIGTALTLRGRGPGTVIASPGALPVVEIAAANVTIDSLVLQGNQSIGAQIDAQATLRAVVVESAVGKGVVVSGTGIATLDRVTIRAVSGMEPLGVGLSLESGSNATVLGSRIEDAATDGIHAEGATFGIRGTEVVRSGNYGIYIGGMSTGSIEAQSRVLQSAFVGIAVFSSQIAMRDSEASESGPPASSVEDGLWLATPTSAIVERNTFRMNRGYGIYCSSGVDANQCLGNVYTNNNLGGTTCASCN